MGLSAFNRARALAAEVAAASKSEPDQTPEPEGQQDGQPEGQQVQLKPKRGRPAKPA